MKRRLSALVVALSLLVLCGHPVRAAWDKGFNFRGTSGYVSDGATETYVLAEGYPTTRNSVTFGFTSGVGSLQPVDRSAANDRRLAGINYDNTARVFQIDLPSAGTYTVHLALGDQAGGGNASCTVVVKDTATTLATVNFDASVANQFTDATGAALTNVTWPAGEVGASLTFATTTLNLALSSAGYWTIAHVFVSQGGAAPAGRLPCALRLLGVGCDNAAADGGR